MRQIGKLAELYRRDFGGPEHPLPAHADGRPLTGKAWLDKLRMTVVDGQGYAVFNCPLSSRPNAISYRGPALDTNAPESYSPTDAFVGDEPDDHGDPWTFGVNALARGGHAVAISPKSAVEWTNYISKTSR